MTNLEESILVRRAQQGDRDAYGRLAERYSSSLLGIAYSGVKNFAAAEDIAQDALLLAFENLARLKRPAKFGGWIRTIVRNLCFQWRKNADYRRELERENRALRERLGYDNISTPLAMLEVEERHGQLRRALEALPELEREALLSFYFEGQRIEAAAVGAGISAAAMRKRVQRGRDRLRDALNAELDAALTDAGRREGRTSMLLAALASGAVYSRAGAEAVLPSSGFTISVAPLVGIVVVAVLALAMVAGAFSTSRGAHTTYVYPDTTAQVVDRTSESAGVTVEQQTNGTEAELPRQLPPGASALHAALRHVSLKGTIVDAIGNPVQGADVEAIAADELYRPRRRERNIVASAVSGADGTYRLEGLPENLALRLRIFHPDWAVHGSSVRIDAAVPPESVDVQLMEPDVCHGIVTDGTGSAISGASVSVLAVRSPAEMEVIAEDRSGSDGVYGPLLDAESDETGRFQLTNLPKGWVLAGVVATMPGYGIEVAVSEAGEQIAAQERAKSYFTAWSKLHFPSPWESANIILSRGGTLSGVVYDGSGDTSVPDATVKIRGSNRGTRLRYCEETLTDPSGRYEFHDLPSGGLEPIVATRGTQTSAFSLQFMTSGGKLVENLRLAPGGAISGKVIETNSGLPLSSAQVRLYHSGGSGERRTMTDRAGHFEIQNLPPSSWTVGLVDNLFDDPNAYARIDLKLPGTLANTTIYADSSLPRITLEERIEKLGGINGIVADSNGGQVGKVHVWLQSRGTTPIDTDARGGFVFDNTVPGEDVVHAVDPVNYRYGHVGAKVRSGKVTTVSVQLDQDAGRVAGVVRNSAGSALGISVPVELTLGEVSRIVDTDVSGHFDTGAMPPGSYSVRVNVDELDGFRAEEPISLELDPGVFLENLQLVVNRMVGTVRGQVTDATGSPLADIPVRIHGISVNNIQTVTDAEGKYAIELLDADEAIITAGNPPKNGEGGEKPWAVVRRTNLNDRPQDMTVFEPGLLRMSFELPQALGKQPVVNIIGELGYLGGFEALTGEHEVHLQPDRYQITMFDESGKILDERIQIRSGEVADLGRIVPYGNSGSLIITVASNGKAPDSSLGEITVLLDPFTKGVAKYAVERDADGTYRSGTVVAGEYRAICILQRDDGQQWIEQQEITIASERETSVAFDIIPCDTVISGTIAFGEGEEVVVWLFDGDMVEPTPGTVLGNLETTKARARTVVGEDGTYRFEGAAPGKYCVVLTKSSDAGAVVAAGTYINLVAGIPLVWESEIQ